MKSIFKRISHNLDLTFFYLFILSIPLGTKLIFLSKDSYFTGAFVHYTTFFLYLSDIFFALALFFWILKQARNKYKNLPKENEYNQQNTEKCHPEFISGSKRLAINYNRFRNKFGMTRGILKIITFRRRHSRMSPLNFRENAIKSEISNNKHKISSKQNIIYYLLFFLLICAVLSIFSAKNNLVGTYQVLKLFEFVLLFILCGKLINSLKKLCFCFILILSTGFTQAVISVAQYYKQSSLGLKWLGEPILSPDLAGVAKIVIDGEKIIRAYGTFPHPNVLAGFLLMSLFISFYFLFSIKIKLSSSVIPVPHLNAGGIQYLSHFKQFLKQNWRFLLLIILISVQFLAFILTFSRTAWLAILFSLFCFIIFHKIVSRETIPIFALFKRKFTSLIIIILVIACFSALFSPQISTRLEINKNNQAISDRFLFNSFAFNMIKKNPFLGVGMGNFVLNIYPVRNTLNNSEKIDFNTTLSEEKPLLKQTKISNGVNNFAGRGVLQYAPTDLKSWQYQPVHNFYLLIVAEIGIIGLILFLLFVFKVIKTVYLKTKRQIVPRETIFILSIFLSFLFIGLFDHYFWTIQQGQLTFWLILGLLMASCRIKK